MKLERIVVAGDLAIDLETPRCELGWDGCTGVGAVAFRIHDCALYIACPICRAAVEGNISETFRRFGRLWCGQCGIEFTQTDYSNAIDL